MQNQSEFDRRYNKALEELGNTTLSRWRQRPYLHRLAIKLGIESRPPYYNSFVFNFITSALVMSFAMGVSTWIAGLMSSPTITILSFIGAILIGLMMALDIRFTAQNHNLSKWSDL